MKTRIAINLLFLLSVIFLTADLHADWNSDWKQTVAAAKKEGRLNLYVGRYGQAALLDEFKKDYPEIKIVSVNGTGDQLATRIAAETRAGKTIADIYSGGPNSSYSSLYRGKILDSIKSAFILPEVRRRVQMVRWQAYLHGQRGPIHLCLHRDAWRPRPVLQFQPRQRERV